MNATGEEDEAVSPGTVLTLEGAAGLERGGGNEKACRLFPMVSITPIEVKDGVPLLPSLKLRRRTSSPPLPPPSLLLVLLLPPVSELTLEEEEDAEEVLLGRARSEADRRDIRREGLPLPLPPPSTLSLLPLRPLLEKRPPPPLPLLALDEEEEEEADVEGGGADTDAGVAAVMPDALVDVLPLVVVVGRGGCLALLYDAFPAVLAFIVDEEGSC